MPLISYHAGINDITIHNLSSSGIGFYGSNFGNSVAVGSYQQTTFVTNSAGTSQGPQINNCTYLNVASGMVNSATSGVNLLNIPNYLATLNIRFTHTSAVKTQNAKCYIYDRTSINNPASGVTTKFAEIIHPNNVLQTATGSGDGNWLTPTGSSVVVDLVASPGTSGFSPNGGQSSDFRHDWYACISASPDSIGSKTLYGLYTSLEYL